MLEMDIPGFGLLNLKHLVSDFNGTLSIDGKLLPGVREHLKRVAGMMRVHILTADTFGRAKSELEGINCELRILKGENLDIQKEEYVKNLGPESVVAFGNGNNDRKMLKAARIGIAVTESEGCSVEALLAADIQAGSAHEAFDLLLNPERCKSTLRN